MTIWPPCARLEAINLHGLVEAADAWLGEDPAQVGRMLASFQEHSYGELPRVTSWCWAALAPLALNLPPGLAPRTLDGLLAGIQAEAQVTLDALADCRHRADCVPPVPAPAGTGGQLVTELWRRALVAAVIEFWALVAGIYRRARIVLLRGRADRRLTAELDLEVRGIDRSLSARRLSEDYAETCRLIGIERAGLREITERIEVLANRAAGIDLSPPSSDEPEAVEAEEACQPSSPEGTGWPDAAYQPVEATRADEAGAIAESGDRRCPCRGRSHQWAPVAFLVISTWLAVGVIFFVLHR